MAEIVKPVQSTMFTFVADGPQTPPHTPTRTKIRFERAGSPAPSIHPTETCSPAKPQTGVVCIENTVVVSELDEMESARLHESELVYPSELEETSDAAQESEDEHGSSDSEMTEPELGIARRLSRMHCGDSVGESEMQRARRKRRSERRVGRRMYKRTHSTSIDSESEVTDLDTMADHDLSRSARRLRRKCEVVQDQPNVYQAIDGQRFDLPDEQESPTALADSRRLFCSADARQLETEDMGMNSLQAAARTSPKSDTMDTSE